MVDIQQEFLQGFIGRPAIELPTPAFVLNKPIVQRNCQRLHEDVKSLGIKFRPHVKTLKSEEVTRLMLGDVSRGCVASTLREIRGLLPLAKEGLLDEVLYGLPVRPGALPQLLEYSKTVKVLVMIDHESQIDAIEKFAAANAVSAPWSAFIKIDMGTQRAGKPLASPQLKPLINRIESSSAVSIYGFYCHAGHSYGSRSKEAAAEVLHDEVNAAVEATALMEKPDTPVVISFGSTPTAHVVYTLKKSLPATMTLELHAGNFPANDLQQLGTGCIDENDQAIRVLSEVCSVYPERNEALINAGCIALARESGPIPGYGKVVGNSEWHVGRVSQEHGILVSHAEGEKSKAEEAFKVGDPLFLHIQHACITAAAHHYYFVVDEQDVVREIWYPWKGW
ncbi:putative serine dehydratase domain-containing protein [Phyllosticta citriasiana]|uniref:putative serine dehydratase domain-containing protein n=1 Tax=Phyllosticta citriasiana TaxID=595635 RepID=UPI0030FDDB43